MRTLTQRIPSRIKEETREPNYWPLIREQRKETLLEEMIDWYGSQKILKEYEKPSK